MLQSELSILIEPSARTYKTMQNQQVIDLAYPLLLLNYMETHPGDKMILEGGDEKRKAGNNLVTIRGILVPVDWDEKGNVFAIAISTYDEVEYLIESNEKEKELKAFIREELEVSGILKKEKNRLIMQIKKYRLKPGLKSAQNSIKQSSKKKK